MANEIHRIGRILAIMDGEGWVEADLMSVFSQETRPDAVECPGPSEGGSDRSPTLVSDLVTNPVDAFRHFHGGSPRKRQEKNAARIGAIDDEMGDAMGERVGFPRSRACDDEEGRPRERGLSLDAVLGGPSLLRIECFEKGGGHVESYSSCEAHLVLFLVLFATLEACRGKRLFSALVVLGRGTSRRSRIARRIPPAALGELGQFLLKQLPSRFDRRHVAYEFTDFPRKRLVCG